MLPFKAAAAVITGKLPGAYPATDVLPAFRKVGDMGSDTTWADGEVLALAGFDHDKKDVLRRILNSVDSSNDYYVNSHMTLVLSTLLKLRVGDHMTNNVVVL